MSREEDIWYAASITRVVLAPRQTLETFGTTTIRYHVVSELMDKVNRVRVREGRVYSERPQILTPSQFHRSVQGFGDKAEEFAEWLAEHDQMTRIIRYGLQLRKDESGEQIVADDLDSVAERVKGGVENQGDNLSAVVVGADELWEVSLLKFLVEYIERSAPTNLQEYHAREIEQEQELRAELERDFAAAQFDAKRITRLGEKLQRHGLFEEYEDRFYNLVRQHS